MILRTALDAGSVVPESQDFGARALEATDPDFRLARHPGAIRKGHISEMPTNRQPGFWIAVNSGRNSPPKATFYCSKVYSA